MSSETFTSGPKTYKITVYPAPPDGEKHPMILLVHGNFGLGEPYGDQIQSFAKELATLGYLTAVPQYYADDDPHLTDQDPIPMFRPSRGDRRDRRTRGRRPRSARPDRVLAGSHDRDDLHRGEPAWKGQGAGGLFRIPHPDDPVRTRQFPADRHLSQQARRDRESRRSQELDRLLPSTIPHELFSQYDETTEVGYHAFRPDGDADRDSRQKAKDWFVTHLPPNRTKMA